ncbi:Putative beta-barrel porin-2, OmpL-like. bbp2 [Chitinophaga eiseniae]|uniref:Putative beta-barrel porin-2, OmpL-like. bbp2 n=1 Tax=Chitinophaga eiseniae TaxID=634771 RepID=A0A1T4RD78_9BACT|nr:porin [Chitinophaga eiseniae]SKA13982.1 Putative beta-barrel porin-2, OmpL-like. bbp2 [Chitinophaga eiseniae]
MKKILLLVAVLAATITLFAQTEPTTEKEKEKGKLTFSGYAEAYYSYDFNQPANHTRPGFLYNFNRHNELNLNLAMLKANYTSDRVRGNIALMAGTYAQYNLAAEPSIFQYVYEANVGVRVGKNVWIDAGIMPAHIGFESAIGKDCYTLTRSMLAENSPYYETGAKITWTPNDKWSFAAMYLNGWQRTKRVDGNQTPNFGTQITFKPSAKVLLNWSTYAGNDLPDSTRRMRYFNNLYGTFGITDKFSLIAGIDYGLQQKAKGSSDLSNWYTPIVIARYAFTDKLAAAGRVEYFNDADGVVIATDTPHGFQTTGYSLNLDFAPVSNVMFRVEGRMFNGRDKTFIKGTDLKNNNAAVTASLAVWF